MKLTEATLATSLFGVFLQGVLSQSQCTYNIWSGKQVTFSHQFGDGMGLLASVPSADTKTDCVLTCTEFTYCYLAESIEYPQGGGNCKLFYYNFPPKYMYEIDSSMRLMEKEFGEDETALMFNLTTCKNGRDYAPKECTFKADDNFIGRPSLNLGGAKSPRSTKALVVADCAAQCDRAGDCNYAVFLAATAQARSISLHGECHHFADSYAADGFALRSAKPPVHPVVISSISCSGGYKYDCSYSKSKDIFEKADPQPILYFAAKTEKDCAIVCGNHNNCGAAVWNPKKLICKLYNPSTLAGAKYSPGKKRAKDSVRLYGITCRDTPSRRTGNVVSGNPGTGAQVRTGGFRRPASSFRRDSRFRLSRS